MVLQDTTDYQQLFLTDTQFIDVRAPVEFAQGSFPSAINLPLLTDNERVLVGKCYKQQGQQAAITLGHKLVNGAIKKSRLEQWIYACQQRPSGYIYCFRGGLRSQLVQTWLAESGLNYPRVLGGYKALRYYLLKVRQQAIKLPIIIVAGKTGSGKTQLITELNNGIDLEAIACHRGSSFGRTLQSQPSQIDFENKLSLLLLKKQQQVIKYWVIEDESRTIGANYLPDNLQSAMLKSGMVIIDEPFVVRLKRLQDEYIDDMWIQFKARDGIALGEQHYSDYLRQGLFGIRKRLGLERYQQLLNRLEQALLRQFSHNDSSEHQSWLTPLLTDYYDPMYRYQLDKKRDRWLFRGDYQAVREFVIKTTQSEA